MRLKRLEVQGFKSFAVQTAFGFEPGLTGIVGPNGCGKSHVVDAIKWVLGETRPTSLRGSEMQDVIFKGTASRSPLGYSEVTIVLDNSSQVLSGPAEIALTRRLYRTGEGEYELNKQDVRRKDLKHLLAGTGLGVNAYSILEQGKIDAVLSANPVDRRAIFEEAAGITRFRTDRKEAIRRLESTEKDLESVRAVLNELERQRNSLRVQASRARKHVELAEQLRGWRAAAALSRFQSKSAERQKWSAELSRLQEMETEARNARTRAENESAQARESAKNLAEEHARLGTELATLQSEEGRRTERARAGREHAASLDRSCLVKQQRSVELQREQDSISAAIAADRELLEGVQTRLQEADVTFKNCVEVSREVNDRYREAGKALDESQHALLQAIESRTAAQNAMADLDAEDRAMRTQNERLLRRLGELDGELTRLAPQHAVAESTLSSANARIAELRNEEARIKSAREMAAGALAEAESRLIDTDKHLSALQSRLSVLRDLENSYAGVEAGAKAVLHSNSPGVLGLLADHVHTELSYALALEAAFGNYAGAVVVANSEVAFECLKLVRERKAGRVSVVVAESHGEESIDEVAPTMDGVLGMLHKFVRLDDTVKSAGSWLMRGVVLVETLADALRGRSVHPEYTYVTLLGERVDHGGISGGQRETAATPIARKSTITALDAELAGTRGEHEMQDRLRLQARIALVDAREAEEQWTIALNLASREGVDAHLSYSEISNRVTRIQSERALLGSEADDVLRRCKEVDLSRGERESRLGTAVTAVETRSADVHEFQVCRVQLEKSRDEAAASESTTRVELARLRGEVDRQTAELARKTDTQARARLEATRLEQESRHDRDHSAQLSREADGLEGSIQQLAARRVEVESRVAEVKRLGAAQAEAAEETVRRERERTAILEEVQSQLGSARLEHQRTSIHCDEIEQRGREEGNISVQDLGDILQLTEDFNLEFADQRISELRVRLERLGSVSSDATVELDEIEMRFADLDRQRADLENARRTLSETIHELDDRCGTQFNEAFESIRRHFGELFRRLFRGGKADIILQRAPEGGDPLEAGVDIMAQPPGKKLQSISLLSGGERTLTALALLFAAFKTKPSPFCVLDEVDAALDDANVERFLNMISEFKDSTQFIVVTHHRRTMAACSALLGVTMPEKGVSQKVDVRLEDVDQVVPGAVGSARGGEIGALGEMAPIREVAIISNTTAWGRSPENATRQSSEATAAGTSE
ncbi:MAG: chromosome segregation protein SMC [Planctomycetes bacterium]|nr:chromosome segregation protein SMC [Planctomycetota bacterium]